MSGPVIREGVEQAVRPGVDTLVDKAGRESAEAAAKKNKSFFNTGPGYAVLGAGGVATLWALPQILGDSCNRTGEQMGLPPNSCGFICAGSCILFSMMSFCMMMLLLTGGMGR
jgi:hypothetical protein